MNERQTCVDCNKKSPETETDYTLISSQFGWRLSRRRDPDGSFIVEWRCPACWRKYKDLRGIVVAAPSSSDPPGAVSKPPGASAPTPQPPPPPTGIPPKPRS